MKKLNNTIFFSGGGTLGSVMPLIAIYKDLKEKYPDYKYVWIGTKTGPESKIISQMEFIPINSGKLRRYFDFKNFIDLFKVKLGFFQSLNLLIKYRPKIILTAGGFVSVPLVIAGRILKIPSFIHQQDFEVGLANKIMARFANKITITLDNSRNNYKKFDKKIIKTGNFVRKDLFNFDYDKAKQDFNIQTNKPILLVLGGGTGSLFINDLIKENLDEILKTYEIIHLTGILKNNIEDTKNNEYHVFEFLSDEMKNALNLADVIITRAGFSTLTEICALKKPVIIIPLPGHQEKNADLFLNKAIVVKQDNFNKEYFIESLRLLSSNESKRKEIGQRIGGVIEIGNDKMVELIEKII